MLAYDGDHEILPTLFCNLLALYFLLKIMPTKPSFFAAKSVFYCTLPKKCWRNYTLIFFLPTSSPELYKAGRVQLRRSTGLPAQRRTNPTKQPKKYPPEPAKMQRSRRVVKSNLICYIFYIVMKMNFRQNNSPITATIMSFFSNLPVNRVITVYAIEPMPIPFAME